ncbi:MAG: energy transducer TonB [Bacteroidota bacterium]
MLLGLGCTSTVESFGEEQLLPCTGTVHAHGEMDVQPEPVAGWKAVADEAQYPEMARRAGIEGVVVANFIVDCNGIVQQPQVPQGLGGGTDEQALQVLHTTRFHPARIGDEPVNVRMQAAFTFSLTEGIAAGPHVGP